ncbi:hypothetical protein C0J52_09305 [Blattella germanica]|nr:hypothetical protein C0J52_09305 [Blattella germanica]
MLELIDAKSSEHQIRKYSISTSNNNISTFSFDGTIILHSLKTFENKASTATHHYTNLGIKKALKHDMNHYALALGHDGSLVCSFLRIEIDEQKSQIIKKSYTEPHLIQSFTMKKTSGFIIKSEQNYNCTPEEQLPVCEFDLDEATRARRTEETRRICKETEIHLKALIAVQIQLCDVLKKRFWDTVETKGRKLRAIMGKDEVESYALFASNKQFEEEWSWIMERRHLEILMQNEDNFRPWESPQEMEMVPRISTGIRFSTISAGGIPHPATNIREAISTNTLSEKVEEEERKVTNDLREYFNDRFNEVMSLKEREMVLVAERNARLRYVLSEMNDTETVVTDPTWTQDEQPERIMKVENNEVPVTPYISPSQQEILDKLAAEAEALRLALLADNFRELALIVMMDGVLELRWEDEIKKDIPKPKCMLEKDPAEFNEEDLRTVKDYEERVAFRLTERERYRKMLEAEFVKLSQTLKFNNRLADLFLLKLKVEAAIGQENLKIIRAKVKVKKLSIVNEQISNLKKTIKNKEAEIAALQETIHKLNNWTNECRSVYESQVAKEKNLEKNFKKEFPEVSQIVFEQLTKFYKRRPKMHQKALMSATLLNELSRCTMTTDRPSFLPPEYIDFLKGLDQIDNYSNSPPIINEELWNTLCRVRRQKVECELKVRCSAVEVAESEQTLSVYQKRLGGEKQNLAALNEELQKTKTELLDILHNSEIQIVIKGGLVEVKTTGALSDFDDAVLITREKVESINELVKVTKDIQMFLRRRVHGISEEKVIMSLEREVALLRESYEETVKELQGKMDELDKKIAIQNKANRELDNKITAVNVDVSEQQLQRDIEYETRHSEAAKERMASIVKRSQLVALIQKQHTEILGLQTELELLRLKTYPTLKFKTLI